MAQIQISQLTTGVPKGTDQTPATDVTDTTQAASGTTKKYIRSDELNFYLQAQGLRTYSAVRVATTLALTVTYANGTAGVGATLTNAGSQAALSIDGVALAVADRVLVKNQASAAQNGIYTVTTVGTVSSNWVMTRAVDYDEPSEVIQGAVVLSDQGTANAGLLWQETGAGPFTIGTTPITFAQYSLVSAGGTLLWTTTTGTTQAAGVNNGYVSGNAAQSTFTLPAIASVGDIVALEGLGAGGWVLTANTGQTIKIATGTTSSGGSLTSAAASDNVYVTCIVANTTWRVQTTNSTGLVVA